MKYDYITEKRKICNKKFNQIYLDIFGIFPYSLIIIFNDNNVMRIVEEFTKDLLLQTTCLNFSLTH